MQRTLPAIVAAAVTRYNREEAQDLDRRIRRAVKDLDAAQRKLVRLDANQFHSKKDFNDAHETTAKERDRHLRRLRNLDASRADGWLQRLWARRTPRRIPVTTVPEPATTVAVTAAPRGWDSVGG
jgi:hypothetical protein